MTGTQGTAELIAAVHHGSAESWDVEQIGAGSQRTAYLAEDGIVYKIGDDGANRQEVAALATIRERGDDYAPDADLYEVTTTDVHGDAITCTVVAMPYLPEDGSVTGDRPIFAEAADLNPHGNVHANGGRLWLIDAGGL